MWIQIREKWAVRLLIAVKPFCGQLAMKCKQLKPRSEIRTEWQHMKHISKFTSDLKMWETLILLGLNSWARTVIFVTPYHRIGKKQ